MKHPILRNYHKAYLYIDLLPVLWILRSLNEIPIVNIDSGCSVRLASQQGNGQISDILPYACFSKSTQREASPCSRCDTFGVILPF